jgi:hypothetical protein
MVKLTVDQVVALPRVTTGAEVRDRLHAFQEALSPEDGVYWFTFLYAHMSAGIASAIATGAFEDTPFLEQLDVAFAQKFFDQMAFSVRDPDGIAHCWRPLFDRRDDRRVLGMQFALAGLNAHVNNDLAVALFERCQADSVTPKNECPQHRDFSKINTIMASIEPGMKKAVEDEMLRALDQVMGSLDERVAHWTLAEARENAWRQARVLWGVRRFKMALNFALESLDRLVGFAGRGLLVAVG